jgi:hypothetical protein
VQHLFKGGSAEDSEGHERYKILQMEKNDELLVIQERLSKKKNAVLLLL